MRARRDPRRALPLGRRVLLSAFVLCMAGTLAVTPADAQVRLGRETGFDARVQVMSWWEIPFRSIVRQQYDFSCGSAAVATLLSYHYDRRTAEPEPFAWMWRNGDQDTIRRVGFSMFEMRAYLASLGYRAEGFRLTLDQLRNLRRPSIALINSDGFRHFIVIKGVRGDRVLVGDSVRGLNEYSLADFGAMWNGIVLSVIDTPDEATPRFNLASDWGPWATAPLEYGGGMRVAVGDLTTHLPPLYQVSEQILLAVRVGTVR